jgi:AcrR family transcriptional regulator
VPRASFQNLPPERRATILEVAAREFGDHGFEGASLNHILSQAGVSKGAAYYYFEDKADLFAAAALHALALTLDLVPDPRTIPAEEFWPRIALVYRESMQRTRAHPWAIAMVRAIWASTGDARAARAVEPVFRRARDLLAGLVDRGVAVGAVRGDVPRELLVDLLVELDGVVDRWLVDHLERMAPEALEAVGAALLDMTRRMLAPPGGAP